MKTGIKGLDAYLICRGFCNLPRNKRIDHKREEEKEADNKENGYKKPPNEIKNHWMASNLIAFQQISIKSIHFGIN